MGKSLNTGTVILFSVFLLIAGSCGHKQNTSEATKLTNDFSNLKWYEKPMLLGALQCNFNEDNLAVIGKWVDMGFNVDQLFHSIADDYSAIYDPAKHKEILKAYVKKAHEKGLKVILYLNVHILGPNQEKYKEQWSQRKADGSINYLYGTYPSICMNSPWKDYFYSVLDSLKEIDIDGIFLDGPAYCKDGCRCKYCKALHRKLFGGTLNDPEKIWEFNAWTRENFLQGAYDHWKKNNPDKLFYMNLPIMHTADLYTDVKKAQNYNDIMATEGGFMFYEPAKNGFLWKTSYAARMLEAVAPDKPRVIFMAADHKPWNWWLHTPLETKLCIASTVANGANIWYGLHGSTRLLENDGAKAAKEMFHFLKKNEEVLTQTKSVADVALLYSFVNNRFCPMPAEASDFTGKNREVYSRDNTENGLKGYYSMLMESHIPFDLVTDINLDVLPKYKVLIVPAMGAMDDKTEAALRDYVRNGGTLITELGTSLNDGKGKQKKEFGLSDVLGISLAGGYKEHENFNYFKIDPLSKYNEVLPFPLVPLPLLSVGVKANPGAQVQAKALTDLAGRYVPLTKPGPDFFITNDYDKGRSYYFAGSMGTMYNDYHVREYRILVTSIIKDKLGDCIQFTNAPLDLEVVLRKQGNRYILHLVNFQGSMPRPMENLTPVVDLKVKLPQNIKIHRATSLMLDKELRVDRSRNELALPKLNEYDILVIE